jgi:hypothetical protein
VEVVDVLVELPDDSLEDVEDVEAPVVAGVEDDEPERLSVR